MKKYHKNIDFYRLFRETSVEKIMNWILDAHIHLSDSQYDAEIQYIIRSMEKLHIKACCVSMDNPNSKKTLELATESDLIFPFVGIHPEKFKDNLDDMEELILQNNDKISGIGEIGLDRKAPCLLQLDRPPLAQAVYCLCCS